jgi:cellulose synthase/poly-beta-1,6-N-acetylglucosamine synthase-like glycosyltransferase
LEGKLNFMKEANKYPYGLSIVLPAYNEEENIQNAVARCFAVLEQLGRPHEVIVVNDGSKDQTSAKSWRRPTRACG